jgi:hypothetical protein
MDMHLKEKFIKLWGEYFKESEHPIAFYYTDQNDLAEMANPPSGFQCFMGVLSKVRKGSSLCFEQNSIGCSGGKRSLGFSEEIPPNFEYFASCGIPGKFEGERYKKSPELVREMMNYYSTFKAPAKYIVFKRWDTLEQVDKPEVVIFFAQPDELSGLFTLANFDEVKPDGVISPFSSGCGSIVQHPYLERDAENPKCILGMFDVSARPYVPKDVLTFAVPINKFIRMIENMEESFLITPSWGKVKKRIAFKGNKV